MSGPIPGEGGRVTELMTRPLIATFWPELSRRAAWSTSQLTTAATEVKTTNATTTDGSSITNV